MREGLPAYDPREDDPKPREYKPYVEKQTDAEYLQSHGIIPSKNEPGNRNLVLYIKRGNLTVGDNIPQRIEIARSAQEKWLGQRVRNRGGVLGTVTSLSFRSLDSVVEASKYKQAGNTFDISPYKLVVKWDDNERRGPVSVLEVVRLVDTEPSDQEKESGAEA